MNAHSPDPSPTRSAEVAVALDLPEPAAALALARDLRGIVPWVKIGPVLFLEGGEPTVEGLRDLGFRIFLDMKFHDIPNVVGRACERAAAMGISLLTVHAAGGRAMVGEAAAAVHAAGARVVAVTVLTSLGDDDLASIGLEGTPEEAAVRLARGAVDWGADGVVLSPRELAPMRRALGPDPFLVTPGIRDRAAQPDDQTRVLGPAEAARGGSDLLVIGRPITRATDPAGAAAAIVRQVADA